MSRSASEVSVVTVNWNGQDHLTQLLPSLMGLGVREVIVVDNGSTDGSRSFVRRHYPQVQLLENQVNRGFSQPNNLGARQAQGRYVAFINNDMRAHANWIDAALTHLSPEVPCVASRILDWEGRRVDFNGSSLQYLGYALQKDQGKLLEEVSHSEQILFPCGGAMLIERAVFLQLGGFDPDFFALFEDVDLGWRLWIAGFAVALAPESIVYHRGHATLETQENEKTRYLMHRNALLTIMKNYEEENFRKILPLAILLALKRSVRSSGVRKESFYLWSQTRHRLRAEDSTLQAQLIDALNHLVALDDALQLLPQTLEKRRQIKAFRRRSDAEITTLFGDPFRAIVEDPLYLKEELEYLEMVNLDALFDLSDSAATLETLPSELREKIRTQEAELKALQWLGTQALLRPPGPESKIQRFFSAWRTQGFQVACRRLVEYVSRAV